MFLQLNHQKLEVFKAAKAFTFESYKITKVFPPDERFNMTQQIRTAGLSVGLNIAEGSSRKSEIERKRYYEISRGSLIEIDAAFDIANQLGYFGDYNLTLLGELTNRTLACFRKCYNIDIDISRFRFDN